MEQLTFGSIFAVGSRPLTDLQQQNSTRANLLTLALLLLWVTLHNTLLLTSEQHTPVAISTLWRWT